MKVMVLVKATQESEAGVMPTPALLAEMDKTVHRNQGTRRGFLALAGAFNRGGGGMGQALSQPHAWGLGNRDSPGIRCRDMGCQMRDQPSRFGHTWVTRESPTRL
jgi:hypothetical protein